MEGAQGGSPGTSPVLPTSAPYIFINMWLGQVLHRNLSHQKGSEDPRGHSLGSVDALCHLLGKALVFFVLQFT